MKYLLVLAVCISILAGCKNDNNGRQHPGKQKNGHMLLSVAYCQNSAEYRALFYQAYLLAKYRLDEKLENRKSKLTAAVITDIDESVLDNSPFEARMITDGIDYPGGWKEWCEKSSAKALPGSLEFFKYAAGKGVEIFYISNRSRELSAVTIKNLANAGFPMADSLHCIFKDKTSSKEERRMQVKSHYDLIMLIGDNLNDFSNVFENKDIKARFQSTDSLQGKFGDEFIVLPNPMYGDWENAIYHYNFKIENKEKREMLHKSLRTE